MRIEISKNFGLCGGCTNAIDTALRTLESKKNVVIFKPIVHNKNVNAMLEQKGATIKNNIDDLKSDETVIIRTHGEPNEVFETLKKRKIDYIDCTCPVVKSIHEKVEKFSALGYKICIIGKPNHPEVIGTAGYCQTEPVVINNASEVREIDFSGVDKVFIICQTTFNMFEANCIIHELENIFRDKNIHAIFENTLCNVQRNINNSSLELAKTCDVMIVVGGENSSNTHELFENVKKVTKAIFLSDIHDWKNKFESENIKLDDNLKIGITAGASTMREEIFDLKNAIQNEFKNQNMQPT